MNTRPQYAFTLIELLFTLAIAAILMIIATPALQHTLMRTRITQADNQLIRALNLSRSEAVNRNSAAILCPSSDGLQCSPRQNWEGGWLVGIDQNHDYQPDDAPVHVFGALSDGIRVHSSKGRLHVRFLADGSAPGSNISLIVCQAGQPETARSVVVSNSGRPRQGTATPAQAQSCSQS